MNQNNDRPAPARILLVEDDDVARASLLQVLRKVGHQVEAVPDGETAFERLDQSHHGEDFDVVLSDLILREIDGVQVLRKARQLADPPEVILLTGFGTLQTAIEALRIGASDYLLKPCKPEELLNCIAEAWRRRDERRTQQQAINSIASGLSRLQGRAAPAAEPALDLNPARHLVVGALQIDRQEHAVSFRGEPITLTPTEYGLICCLAENVGRMVSYNELARQVYQHSVSEGDTNILLKTHIHNLRRKLDPDLIVNVRSAGYRLLAMA